MTLNYFIEKFPQLKVRGTEVEVLERLLKYKEMRDKAYRFQQQFEKNSQDWMRAGGEISKLEKEIKSFINLLPCPVHEIYLEREIPPEGLIIFSSCGPESPSETLAYRESAKDYFFRKESCNLVSGKGFIALTGKLSSLEWDLLGKIRQHNIEGGYTEISSVPLILKKNYFEKIGQYPLLKEDLIEVRKVGHDRFFLIPTGESAIMSLLQNAFFERGNHKFFAITECFRDEAGKNSLIKDYLRLKQFKKGELIEIFPPENEEEVLKRTIDHVVSLLIKLGLDYRILLLNPKDIAHQSRITYDIEVLLPVSKRWVEVSSISSCGSFQTSKLGVRIGGKVPFSLNGSCLPLPRVLMALYEKLVFSPL